MSHPAAGGRRPAHEPNQVYPPRLPLSFTFGRVWLCHPRGVSAAGGDRAPIEVDGRLARRLDAVRAAIAVILGLLAILALVSLLDGPPSLRELVAAGLVAALGLVLLAHRRTTKALADRRRSREASMTRILQGLSRSLSPDSVVEAIVQELRTATGADHVVVARVRQPDHVVEVTLASANPLVPASRTLLRPEVPELSTDRAAPLATDGPPRPPEVAHPPAGGSRGSPSEPAPDRVEAMERSVAEVEPFAAGPASQAAAEEIARRVRSAYGLPYTLAAAARRRAPVPGRAHPVQAHPGAVERGRPAPPRLGGTGGRGRLRARLRPRGGGARRQPRRADRAAQPALFRRAAGHHAAAAAASTDSLGILMVDIDRFKRPQRPVRPRRGRRRAARRRRRHRHDRAGRGHARSATAARSSRSSCGVRRRRRRPRSAERVRAAVAGLDRRATWGWTRR